MRSGQPAALLFADALLMFIAGLRTVPHNPPTALISGSELTKALYKHATVHAYDLKSRPGDLPHDIDSCNALGRRLKGEFLQVPPAVSGIADSQLQTWRFAWW